MFLLYNLILLYQKILDLILHTIISWKFQTNKELQQIAFNHSTDIDFRDFMNIYKKCTAKPYSFLVIDTTLASENPLRFRNNLLEGI